MVYLHNGILCSREKEGAYTLCNSMDGTGEHYVKWNNFFLRKKKKMQSVTLKLRYLASPRTQSNLLKPGIPAGLCFANQWRWILKSLPALKFSSWNLRFVFQRLEGFLSLLQVKWLLLKRQSKRWCDKELCFRRYSWERTGFCCDLERIRVWASHSSAHPVSPGPQLWVIAGCASSCCHLLEH